MGVDFTGALHFKDGDKTVKGYVLIFSCAVTRHVSFKLVKDMTTEGFVQAMRQHAAIYGCMTNVLCDNAQTFKAGEKHFQEIFEILKDHQTTAFWAGRKINFQFIPRRAAWFGSHYERLIGILKNHLRRSIGQKLLQKEELQTCLHEVACVMNERPLTANVDQQGSLHPITPNLLVYGHHMTGLPSLELTAEDFQDLNYDLSAALKDLYSLRALVRSEILKRFYEDYVAILRQRHAYKQQVRQSEIQVKVGDICLIHHESPRKYWSLGLVTKLCPGPDGQVRVAELKTASGSTNRPVAKLYPIGVNHPMDPTQTVAEPQGNPDPDPVQQIVTNTRPRRRAAVQANQRITQLLNDSDDSDLD